MLEKEVLKNKLREYGFPELYHQEILNGRQVDTMIGTIKLNRKTGVITVKDRFTLKTKKRNRFV